MFVWSWVAGAVASCTVPLQSAAAGSRCKVPLQGAAGQSAVSAWKSCGGAVSGYHWSRSFAMWGLCWHIFFGGGTTFFGRAHMHQTHHYTYKFTVQFPLLQLT